MAGHPRTTPRGPSRRHLLRTTAACVAALAVPRLVAAAHMLRPWPASRMAPPLDLVDLEGKRWRLESLAGRVVVVNFWATWCEPCRVELPSLDALAARRRREGVTVIAVNYLEPPDKIKAFLERAPFKAPILLDSEGDTTVAWTPRVFPSTVIVGRDGQPVTTVVGDLDWGGDEAKALLDPLVALPRKSLDQLYYR